MEKAWVSDEGGADVAEGQNDDCILRELPYLQLQYAYSSRDDKVKGYRSTSPDLNLNLYCPTALFVIRGNSIAPPMHSLFLWLSSATLLPIRAPFGPIPVALTVLYKSTWGHLRGRVKSSVRSVRRKLL